MPAEPLDEVGPAGDDARLRTAEQLVAGEADEVGAGRERGGGVGSPSTSTSAPEPRSSRSGSAWRRATAANSVEPGAAR